MADESKALAGISPDVANGIATVVESYSLAAIGANGNQFLQALTLAEGMKKLHELLIDEVMQRIMFLQGKRLGFKTDKDKDGGYDIKIVRACFIEAVLQGARPVGNEFNIIAGNVYLAQSYYVRATREYPGVTEFAYRLELGAIDAGCRMVIGAASWKQNGKSVTVENEKVPVRIVGEPTPDNILGKATRKFLRRVLERMTGAKNLLPDGEIEDAEFTVSGGATPPARRGSLADLRPGDAANHKSHSEAMTPAASGRLFGGEDREL